MPFGPCLDVYVLPERPITCISRGSAAGVPLLCGVMRDEFRLFTLGNAALQALDETGLEALAVASQGAEPGRALLQAYRDGSPFDRWSAIVGDHVFRMPALALAEAQASHAPSFVYRVDYGSPMLDGAFRGCHALDIGLVFGTYAVAPFFGTGPEVETVSRAMMTAWTRFAHTGDPTWDPGCVWPRYDEDRATMIFTGAGASVVHDPRPAHTGGLGTPAGSGWVRLGSPALLPLFAKLSGLRDAPACAPIRPGGAVITTRPWQSAAVLVQRECPHEPQP